MLQQKMAFSLFSNMVDHVPKMTNFINQMYPQLVGEIVSKTNLITPNFFTSVREKLCFLNIPNWPDMEILDFSRTVTCIQKSGVPPSDISFP